MNYLLGYLVLCFLVTGTIVVLISIANYQMFRKEHKPGLIQLARLILWRVVLRDLLFSPITLVYRIITITLERRKIRKLTFRRK